MDPRGPGLPAVLRRRRPRVGAGLRPDVRGPGVHGRLDLDGRQSVDNTAVPLPFNTDRASLQVEDFTARTARFVRINCGVRHTSWGTPLVPFGDRPFPSGHRPGIAQGGHGLHEESDHPAAAATDGSPDSRWSSQYEDHQWIQVDLGSAESFDRVAILWEQAYPKTYVIQVSADGDTWTDVQSVDNSPVPLKISVNGVLGRRPGKWGWGHLLLADAGRADGRGGAHAPRHELHDDLVLVGSVNREEFYASCDEHGILVWNDFPNAWGMDPPSPRVQRDRARHRAALPHPPLRGGAARSTRATRRPPSTRACATPSSSRPPASYQNNSAGGIIDLEPRPTMGGAREVLRPVDLRDNSSGFHRDRHAGRLHRLRACATVGGEKEWPIGRSRYYHDWSEHGNQAPQQYRAAIEARLGTATDLDDFAGKAQFVNYENARSMFEAWNAHLWDDASGLMLWMSHPAWHSTVWQTLPLRLRRQRHLLRCPHRLRAPARPG